MALRNTGKLAGRTVFISGASRGIGKAIAVRCAQDGANVVIAAKTAEPHPKLPGTIYSAAKEVEAAGGKCLPCIVDIRYEDQVQKAVDEAVKQFGGIDILVNNASAIQLTGTEQTDMKRYDLMNGINARGTYLCSRVCIPHLKKSPNPHILNISPPLNMNPVWFQGHVAYTMAKYGMSMCALGMASEFKDDGIAVNALWPRTAIYTAAMEMLGGGKGVMDECRKPEIMSDAAYAILCKDSRSFTGNFCIDDTLLKGEGVTDLSQYDCVPGTKTHMPDFFLDPDVAEGGQPQAAEAPSVPSSGNPDLDKTFQAVGGMINEELVKSINGIFAFDLKDDGTWYMDLKNGSGGVGKGDPPTEAGCTMTLGAKDFVDMFAGKVNPASAFMTGKLKIKGDLGLAMKLEKIMKVMKSNL